METQSHGVCMNTSRKYVYLCPCFPLSTFILGQEISRLFFLFASLRLKEYLRGKNTLMLWFSVTYCLILYFSLLPVPGAKHLSCHLFIEVARSRNRPRLGPSYPWLPLDPLHQHLPSRRTSSLSLRTTVFQCQSNRTARSLEREWSYSLLVTSDGRWWACWLGTAMILPKLCYRWCQWRKNCHQIHTLVTGDVVTLDTSPRKCKNISPSPPEKIVQIGGTPIHLDGKRGMVKLGVKLEERQIVKMTNIMAI